MTPGFPEEYSNVPSGGTRQALDTGRETTRNHEKWGTWQWAQSRWTREAGVRGNTVKRGTESGQSHRAGGDGV